MNDVLEQQLIREFGSRATEVDADPTLAARVVARAHVVRRRQAVALSLTAAAAATAVVLAVSVPALRNADGPTPPPPATRTNSDTTVPSSGPIATGYAVNGLLQKDGSRTRTVLVFGQGPSAGSSVQLPAHWVVRRLGRSGDALVVLGTKVEQASADSESGTPFAAYVTPNGRITELRNVNASSVPVDSEGSVWAGAAGDAQLGAGPDGGRLGEVLARPDGDAIVTEDRQVPADQVILGLGPRTVILQTGATTWRPWTFGAAGQPGRALPGTATGWALLDTYPDGRVLLRAPDGLHLVHVDGSPGWVWSKPAQFHWGAAYSAGFSPDGSTIVLGVQEGFVVLSAKDGRLISFGGLVSPLGPGTWENGSTFLTEQYHGPDAPSQVWRCAASSGNCVPIDVRPGDIVLADAF